MIVQLGDLIFNDYLPDSDGVNWYVTGFDGWDSPELRQSASEPTSRHGSVVVKALLAARAMTLSGIVKAPTLEAHYASKERLHEVASTIAVVQPIRVTEDRQRECWVVRSGGLRMRPAGLRAFEFELPLIAPDPLKYPVTSSQVTIAAGASRVVTNEGNFVSERLAVTTGAEGGVRLVNETVGGRGLITDEDVEAGTVFEFLPRTATTPDGRAVYSALSPFSAWWGLQPGQNTIKNNGGVSVTLTYYPAWL